MSSNWQMILDNHAARQAAEDDATAAGYAAGFDWRFYAVALAVGAFLGIVGVAALLR